MQIVEPLVPIEAAEDIDPLGADERGTMPLAPRWRVRGLCGPCRSDPLALRCIQDVELVSPTFPIVATEQKDLVTDEVGSVTSEPRRWCPQDLGLRPLELLRVKDMQVGEVLVATVATKQVELCADHCHGVRVPRLWQRPGEGWLHPGHGLQVNDVHVIETLRTIVAAKHVELVRQPGEGMTSSGRRRRARGQRLVPVEAFV
mmetsp:Transcript_16877/g.38120  ORF Transcript_16877/g.38120 Transcript_16877/m.38120 type:complete len:202 (-) Transcript_16877:427-1032(-)